jgi:hypothetical protein
MSFRSPRLSKHAPSPPPKKGRAIVGRDYRFERTHGEPVTLDPLFYRGPYVTMWSRLRPPYQGQDQEAGRDTTSFFLVSGFGSGAYSATRLKPAQRN